MHKEKVGFSHNNGRAMVIYVEIEIAVVGVSPLVTFRGTTRRFNNISLNTESCSTKVNKLSTCLEAV